LTTVSSNTSLPDTPKVSGIISHHVCLPDVSADTGGISNSAHSLIGPGVSAGLPNEAYNKKDRGMLGYFLYMQLLTTPGYVVLELLVPAPRSPVTWSAAELFAGQDDVVAAQPHADFFTGDTSGITTGPGSSTLMPSYSEPPTMHLTSSIENQAERPRPRLVQGKTQSGHKSEPFSLQNRVFPNNLENSRLSSNTLPPVSAKLLAAKEGHVPAAKSDAMAFRKADHILFRVEYIHLTLTILHPKTHLSLPLNSMHSWNSFLGQGYHRGRC